MRPDLRPAARAGLRLAALALMVLLPACDDLESGPNDRVEDAWRRNAHLELPTLRKHILGLPTWELGPLIFVGVGSASGDDPRDVWIVHHGEVTPEVPSGRTVRVRPRVGTVGWAGLIGLGSLRVRLSTCPGPCRSPAELIDVAETWLDPADAVQPPVGSFETVPGAAYAIDVEGPPGAWAVEYDVVIESY